jgi:hypothetical protein
VQRKKSKQQNHLNQKLHLQPHPLKSNLNQHKPKQHHLLKVAAATVKQPSAQRAQTSHATIIMIDSSAQAAVAAKATAAEADIIVMIETVTTVAIAIAITVVAAATMAGIAKL